MSPPSPPNRRRRRRGKQSLLLQPGNLVVRMELALCTLREPPRAGMPKARLDACAEALRLYPIPILKVEHAQLLKGFNKHIIQAIKEVMEQQGERSTIRDTQEEDVVVVSPIKDAQEQDVVVVSSPIRAIQEDSDHLLARRLSQDQFELVRRKSVQEEEDYQLALRMNGENYKDRDRDRAQAPVLKKAASKAFRIDEDSDDDPVPIVRSPSPGPSVRRAPSASPVRDPVQARSPPAKKKKKNAMDAMFANDPVFNRGAAGRGAGAKGRGRGRGRGRGAGAATSRAKPVQIKSRSPPPPTQQMHLLSDSDEDNDPIPSTSRGPPEPLVSSNPHAMSDSSGESDAAAPVAAPKKAAGRKAKKTPVKRKRRKIPKELFMPDRELPTWLQDAKNGKGQSEEEDDEVEEVERSYSEFTFEPGTFEVILLVDNAEVMGAKAGGKKTKREVTIKELKANGVPFECRHLSLGDFLWVARESTVPIDPSAFRQRQPRELVLPHLVERKRMDDLRSSIMDGRYKEQKGRMKACGLDSKWYLVEEFTKLQKQWSNGKGVSEKALETAIATTATMHGFKLKTTDSQKDSVAFLTLMTRSLRDKFHPLRLRSCSRQDVERGIAKTSDTTLFIFKEFNDDSRKTKPLSLREAFSRMLLCQHGVTWSMATAITERYPTPKALMRALQEDCATEEDRERLLVGIVYDGTKKVRPAVAKIISWVYSLEELG